MVLPGTLQDILEKVQELSASGNSFQLSDPKFVKYLNSSYLYDIPTELRVLKLKDVFVINTVKGIGTYQYDRNSYQSFSGPAYCAKQTINFVINSPGNNNLYAQNQFIENFATADGTTGPFTGTTNQTPILRSVNTIPNNSPNYYPASRVQNLLITTNTSLGTTQNVIDDGNNGTGGPTGNLIDPVTGANRGSINYETGAISVTFENATTSGANITIEYRPISLAQPTSVYFYQQQFTVFPVPDKGYTIEFQCYRTPSQVLMGTENPNAPNFSGQPESYAWWELIAACISKKLYQDRLDPDGVALMQQIIDEQLLQAQTQSYAELGSQRVQTIYQDQLANTNQNFFWGYNNS